MELVLLDPLNQDGHFDASQLILVVLFIADVEGDDGLEELGEFDGHLESSDSARVVATEDRTHYVEFLEHHLNQACKTRLVEDLKAILRKLWASGFAIARRVYHNHLMLSE